MRLGRRSSNAARLARLSNRNSSSIPTGATTATSADLARAADAAVAAVDAEQAGGSLQAPPAAGAQQQLRSPGRGGMMAVAAATRQLVRLGSGQLQRSYRLSRASSVRTPELPRTTSDIAELDAAAADAMARLGAGLSRTRSAAL